jgi:multidrug resistance efflux pump
VGGATQELEFRESELLRTREVHARGLASPDALDRAQVALDTAEANMNLRLAQLEELLSGTTIEELAQAERFGHLSRALPKAAFSNLESGLARASHS